MINLALKEGSPHLPPPLAKKAQHKVGLQYQREWGEMHESGDGGDRMVSERRKPNSSLR